MIIVGDIASPTKEHSVQLKKIFADHANIFANKTFVCNLEGLIDDSEMLLKEDKPVLFNHPSVLDSLQSVNTKAVGLANNHTLDIPDRFRHTLEELDQKGIVYAGAGESIAKAREPMTFVENGKTITVFNACWDFLLYHQKNPSQGIYVHTIDENDLLEQVSFYISKNPEAIVVVYLHWSFDLETLPFPMYRQWARELIDSGVKAVIGCHSHCVQGGEKYKKGFIVYGLGNFYLPWNTFANGKLSFLDFSKMQMVFDLDIERNEATCHWFEYQPNNHSLKHIASEPFEKSKILASYSPYATMSDEEYYYYFKKNRRKKILIPIYKNYKDIRRNILYTNFLKGRGKFARTLARHKIINWQN